MNQQVASPSTKSVLPIIIMGAFACLFAYITIKDTQLPRALLVMCTLVGGLVLFFKGLNNPHVVTYALVAYLPFSRELAGDFGGFATAFNFTNLLMGFIIFVWIAGRFETDEPRWLSTPLNLPIFLFLLVGLLSVVRGNMSLTGSIGYTIIEYKRWITPIFMFFLVVNTVKTEEAIRNVVGMMMIIVMVVGLMAIYEYIDIGPDSSLDKSRVGGIADQPNMLAAFFNYYMFLPMGFFLFHFNQPRYWMMLIPFLICFRGIMVTFSRGGYLAFAAGLYALIFFRSRILFCLLLFVTVVVFLNPILLPAGIRYRMGQTFDNNAQIYDQATLEDSLETSAHSRIEVWRGAVEMIKDYPYMGVGYGLFAHYIQYYWSARKKIDAHNTYLIIGAEMGIPALLIFFWILWVVFWQTFTLYRTTNDPYAKCLALGFIGGLFGLLISNMFGSRLDSQEISSYFWILAGLIVRLRMLDQRKAIELQAQERGRLVTA